MKINLRDDFIPHYVISILKKLKKRGHFAYLVGGAVRDLMSGKKPRDYDIATDANPYKIKSIFKGSYIIGKRFKLVQIKFGKEKIEISTFRKDPGKPPENLKHKEKLIWINKFYGTIEDDAKRRDFTINSLYYNPLDFELIDFTGGYEDLNNKIIKIIGDPYNRLLEDPVRIIRALALSCKLNFKLEPELENAICTLKKEILNIPRPRIQEELLRILRSGFSFDILSLLEEKKILTDIFPFKYEFSENFKISLKIIDNTFEEFSDDEIFLFLYFSIHLKENEIKNIDEESFLYRKGFIKELNQYKVILNNIFYSRKINKKYIKYKGIYRVLKIALKLSRIYPEFKKRVLNWKTFYFLNRKKNEEVK